ncbi:hypothetical protein ACFX58_16670 [Sphingomonas sp. NCPPB 2930]
MRPAPEISIQRCAPPSADAAGGDTAQPWCEVLLHGRPTGRRLKGACLEAALEADGRYLLMLTDDVPFEEFLTLVLLSPRMGVLDKASIGACYNSGRFDGLTVLPGHRLQFHFLGDQAWQLQLLPEPALRPPWRTEPRGVWRRFGFRRHFVVSLVSTDADSAKRAG